MSKEYKKHGKGEGSIKKVSIIVFIIALIGVCIITVFIVQKNNGKETYGSMSGMISYKYNNFVGNRGDTGAKVVAINIDLHEPEKFDKNNDGNGINGKYTAIVDGDGNYKFNKLPCGEYYVFITSYNTKGHYIAYNEKGVINSDFEYLGEEISKEISQEEWRNISATNSSTFMRSMKFFDNIIIEKDTDTVVSYDFGLTKY